MPQMDDEVVERSDVLSLPETQGVVPCFDAMERIVDVLEDDTWPTYDLGVVAVEATEEGVFAWYTFLRRRIGSDGGVMARGTCVR